MSFHCHSLSAQTPASLHLTPQLVCFPLCEPSPCLDSDSFLWTTGQCRHLPCVAPSNGFRNELFGKGKEKRERGKRNFNLTSTLHFLFFTHRISLYSSKEITSKKPPIWTYSSTETLFVYNTLSIINNFHIYCPI